MPLELHISIVASSLRRLAKVVNNVRQPYLEVVKLGGIARHGIDPIRHSATGLAN